MKITLYLKDTNLGALDFNSLSRLWEVFKANGSKNLEPLVQYPELMQLEDLLLLIRRGFLKITREQDTHQDFLLLEINVQGSGKRN